MKGSSLVFPSRASHQQGFTPSAPYTADWVWELGVLVLGQQMALMIAS